MVLKRKYSDSDMSTSSYSLSSPPSFHPPDCSTFGRLARDIIPIHLSGRTRKRHRDNRPSEEIVHGTLCLPPLRPRLMLRLDNTLTILYNAQKQDPTPILSQQPQVPPSSSRTHSAQPSLHSFWALPPRPSGAAFADDSHPPAPMAPITDSLHCDDCDTLLMSPSDEVEGDMMDIDVYTSTAQYSCSAGCGRQVCHQCSVSNLGQDRRCLICASGRRRR